MMRSCPSLLSLVILNLAFHIETVNAQTDLPKERLDPVLVEPGAKGVLHVQYLRFVLEQREETYTIQVPITYTETLEGGEVIEKSRTVPEMRTRTVSVEHPVFESAEIDSGEFRLARANGEAVTMPASQGPIGRTVPAMAMFVPDLVKATLPSFYQKVLRPNTLIVFVADQDPNSDSGGELDTTGFDPENGAGAGAPEPPAPLGDP